jgi:hypothetical protein
MATSLAVVATGSTDPRANECYIKTVTGLPAVRIATRCPEPYGGEWYDLLLASIPDLPDEARERFDFQGGGGFNFQCASAAPSVIAALRTNLRDREIEITVRSWALNPAREITVTRRAIVKGLKRTLTTLDVECIDKALDICDLEHPSIKYTVEAWPLLSTDALGKIIPDGVANAPQVPLVAAGIVSGKFRYLGLKKRSGNTYTVQAVYRDGVRVLPAEYTVVSVAASGGAGYDCLALDFAFEQVQGGRQFDMTYDVLCQNGGANAEYVNAELVYLLNEWGISYDASLLAAPTTAAVIANEMYVDYCYLGVSRRQIIKYLLMLARASLVLQPSGQYALVMDVANASALTLSDRDQQVQISESRDPTRNLTHRLQYRPRTAGSREYQRTRERAIGGVFGVSEKVNPMIRRDGTADRSSDYLAKTDALEEIDFVVHATRCLPGERLTIKSAYFAAATDVIIRTINREPDADRVKAAVVNAAAYAYTPLTIAGDSSAVYSVDYSRTPPAVPTSCVLLGGTNLAELDAAGQAFARVTVQAVPPAINWRRLWVVARNTTKGGTLGPEIELLLNGANYEAVVGDLLSNDAYQLLFYATNEYDLKGAVVIVTHTAATYAGAPPLPGAITVQQTVGRTLLAATPAPSYPHSDRTQWQFRVNAGAWFAIDESAAAASVASASYGASYEFQARFIDKSGNAGPWRLSSAFVPAVNISDTHIVPLGVNAASIGNSSINRGRTNTGTGSVSVSLGPGASSSLVMSLYTLFPRIYAYTLGSINAGTVILTPLLTYGGVPGASGGGPDRAEFGVRNTDVTNTFTVVADYRTFTT